MTILRRALPNQPKAITIDFWDTMVDARVNGLKRQTQRLDALQEVGHATGTKLSTALIEAAYQAATETFYAQWKHAHKTLRTSDLVNLIWEELELNVDAALHQEVVTIFEEGLLYGPPQLAEGLPEALAWASNRFPLAIISDTMFSPGRVIRQYLASYDLLKHFSGFVFSDELGVSKPNPKAFKEAAYQLNTDPSTLLHIGDMPRTDVAGAVGVDAGSVLFTGIQNNETAAIQPHFLLHHWESLPNLLATSLP